MPAKPRWYRRIPDIIAELETLPSPVVDRCVIERLFDVRRRRAIELLEQFGAYVVGGVFVVDRIALIAALREQAGADDVRWECARRQRVVELLQDVELSQQSRRVRIPAKPDVYHRTLDELPGDVRLGHGTLSIDYANALDLLGKLFELSQAIANDFDTFQLAANMDHSTQQAEAG